MEVNLKNIPFDIDFHPSSPIVATGLVDGRLHLYRYSDDSELQRICNSLISDSGHIFGSCGPLIRMQNRNPSLSNLQNPSSQSSEEIEIDRRSCRSVEMEVNLKNIPFDIDFHPSSPIVATGLVDGRLHLYRYSDDSELQRLSKIRVHRKSCRAVRFVSLGSAILTASPDRSILAVDVETGKEIARLDKAHGVAINRLVNLTEATVASGDDAGCIKIWDTRQRTCCNSFDADEDLTSEATYISDMTYVPASMQLLASSGDGTLSVCSLRKNKVQNRSEFAEDALLSVVTMKNGRKVVCGSESGALLLYSWGHFEDCSDRFLGHAQPVDALLKLDEDTVVTGSSDGLIRLVGILPNRIVRPLAEHSEYPIEGLAFSHDRKYLGSISHDQMLKLWDLQELLDGKQDASGSQMVESDSDVDEMDTDKPLKAGNKKMKVGKSQNSTSTSDFFADMDDS